MDRLKRRTASRLALASLAVLAVAVLSLALVTSTARADHGDIQTADLTTGLTATDLVNTLLGDASVSVSNVTLTGAQIAAGTFSHALAPIGLESGVILSTGDIADVAGPNQAPGTTTSLGQSGDSAIATEIAVEVWETFDATVLEFDFVPSSDVLTFSYVFGSEEYNEWVDEGYNDAFAFFVNGTNVALLPDGVTPVSIDNVNLNTNSSFFRDNELPGATLNTELDGLTVVLTVQADVTPGENNHIKMVIADVGDSILDSAVFIGAGTFVAGAALEVQKVIDPATDPVSGVGFSVSGPEWAAAQACTTPNCVFQGIAAGTYTIAEPTPPDGTEFSHCEVGGTTLADNQVALAPGDSVVVVCHNVVIAERVAPSVTTAIHDAGHGTVTSVPVGTTVHDQATVSGPANDSPTPTGTATFSWFENGTCEGTPTATSATLALSGGVIDATGFTQTPQVAGSFAFRASYSGDENYLSATSACEPLTVTLAAPTVATEIHSEAHQAVTSVTVGTTVHDEVTVAGVSGLVPTGAVTVSWFTNGTCAGDPAATSGALGLSGGMVDAVGFAQTPAAAGMYAFRASYSGDASYAAAASPCEPLEVTEQQVVGDQGCSPGFWKNHPELWATFASDDGIDVFSGVEAELSGATLMEALRFGGGKGVVGAQRILLRAAVASLLNAAHPDVDFPRTEAEIIAAVDAALASGDRGTILALAGELDMDNNLGCSIDAHGDTIEPQEE